MKLSNAVFVLLLLAVCVCGFAEGKKEVDVSKFPERPITTHVPWGVGGGSDLVFRTVGEVFTKYSGGQVQLIKNVPGSAGAVGIMEYLPLKPDGYNILTWAGAQTIKTHVSKVDYSAADFKPVIRMVSNYTFLLVQDNSPFKTLKDFIDFAKANPGKVNMGHAGTGGGGHLAAILFCKAAGIEVIFIPFNGGGPAVLGLLSGQTMISMNIPPEGLTNIEGGQLRALATMSPERLPQLPKVPTTREAGVDIIYFQSRGIVVHKNTPDAIVKKLHDIFKKCLEDETVKRKMNEMITAVTYGSSEEYGKEIIEEDKLMEKIIRENKIGDKY